MKKLLVLFLTLMLVGLAACSSSEKTDSVNGKNEVVKNDEKGESIEVDKNLLNVEITLPASMFEGEEIDSVISDAEKEGIKINKNDDGSLTYKMSKSKHKEMMKELETGLLDTIEDMKSSGDFTSIQDIIYNKSYSEFILVVDREAYENSFDGFATLGLGLSGMYYQLFNGVKQDDYEVKILVKDFNSNEIFDEIVYPEELDSKEE